MLGKVIDRNDIKLLSKFLNTFKRNLHRKCCTQVTHFTLGQPCYLTLSYLVCNVTPVVPKQELKQPASPLQIFHMRQTASSKVFSKQNHISDLSLFGPFGEKRAGGRDR